MTPPLIFLHGFLGSPDVWDPVIAELNYGGPVEKVWLPGHGLNPSKDLPRFARSAWLIGYSLGARLALSMAEQAAGLVLIGVNPGLRSEEERRQRTEADSALARKLVANGIEAFVDEWEALPLFASQKGLPSKLREQHRRRRTSHVAERVAQVLETSSLGRMPPFWDALKDNKIPIHLITGEWDQKFTAIAQEMTATIPFTTHTTVAGAGHDVVLERPAAVAAEIRAALRNTHA